MIWLLLASLALADPLLDVHRHEWARDDASELADLVRHDDPGVRAAAARALGRLRDPEALPLLDALLADPDPEVEREAAAALGWTPGGADRIRRALDEMAAPRVSHAMRSGASGTFPRLLQGLGFQGGSEDVPRLISALAQPWPMGAAAAEALGRMARREVEGVQSAVPALVAGLGRGDPRTVEAFAYALGRIGLAHATEAEVAVITDRATTAPTARARGWLIRAGWSRWEEGVRTEAVARALADPDPLVGALLLQSVQPGDVPPELLLPALDAPHPWLRNAAVGALAPMASPAVEAAVAARWDGWTAHEKAQAVRLLGAPPPGGDLPIPVRAAVVGLLDDPDALVRAALEEGDAPVRTAAGVALLEQKGLAPETGARLLKAEDPVIRGIGASILGESASAGAVEPLLERLSDPAEVEEVRLSAVEGLAALARARVWRPPAGDADALLSLLGVSPNLPLRAGARGLAEVLGRPVPQRSAVGDESLDEARWSRLGQAAVAVVQTSRGPFRIALEPEVAPRTVAAFVDLAEADHYDGVVFHRVVPGFVVQTGDPRGDGWGGPGFTLPDEVSALPFDEGAVGLARAQRDTGGSQWFVTTADQPHLTGEYTRFGRVVAGGHVLRRLRPGDVVLDVQIEWLPR